MSLDTTTFFFVVVVFFFVVTSWKRSALLFGVLYVFASGRTRGKTASRRTLRIPYLDGPQIGNPVELLPKSDFIQNEALPAAVTCVASDVGDLPSVLTLCPFVYFSSLYERLLKERRHYSRERETRLSRYVRTTIIVTLLY